MERWAGAPASPGVAVGRAAVWRPAAAPALPDGAAGPGGPADPARELERFRAAAAAVARELAELEQTMAPRVGEAEAALFGAQALLAESPSLEDGVARRVLAGAGAAAAVLGAGDELAAEMDGLADAYLRQRAGDVRQVAARIAEELSGRPAGPILPFPDTILFAHDLSPAALARLDLARLRGLACAAGGATSHTAILARGLGVPAVLGLGPVVEQVAPGVTVALDGEAGTVVVAPDAATLDACAEQARRQAAGATALADLKDLPATTADGARTLALLANLGHPREAAAALAAGAAGVGLFRTEFLFLDRPDLPDEDEQYEAYRAMLAAMAPRPVVLRTLDVGGDKPLPALGLEPEPNPMLGCRGIRLWLEREDLAVPQLRAMLRAAAAGHLHILLPMVTTLDEVRRARALVEQVQAGLGAAAGPYRLGIMVEVPAAALQAASLAALVDFISIGTNDLTQYTLAVDRQQERLADLYQFLHPAVLRLVELTVAAGRAAGIPVAVCGEAAADPRAIPVLLGLGVDELSVPPAALPRVKALVRSTDYTAARAAARRRLDGQ